MLNLQLCVQGVLMRQTLAAALPVQAVQDLLVLFSLVAVLLQVCRPIVAVLRQHQLDVAAQRQTLAVEVKHVWVQRARHGAVSV